MRLETHIGALGKDGWHSTTSTQASCCVFMSLKAEIIRVHRVDCGSFPNLLFDSFRRTLIVL